MTDLPDDQVEVLLSEADMKKAIENYLNDHMLKEPCKVILLNYPRPTKHSYQVRFLKSFEPELEDTGK